MPIKFCVRRIFNLADNKATNVGMALPEYIRYICVVRLFGNKKIIIIVKHLEPIALKIITVLLSFNTKNSVLTLSM